MNFSIHLDDATVVRLNKAAERAGLARNRLIAMAVQEWLARNEEKDWPELLAAHFRNPAPELAQETLDFQAWREQLEGAAEPRW